MPNIIDTTQINANNFLDATGSGLTINVNTNAFVVETLNNGSPAVAMNVLAPQLTNQNILQFNLLSPPNTSVEFNFGANGATPLPGGSNTFRLHVHWDANAYITNDSTAGDLIFRTNSGTERLRIGANGTLGACSSPLTNTQTRVFTGACAFMRANTSRSSSVMANEANLTVTLNETGVYEYRAAFYFFSSGTGTASDFVFNINGGGSAVINTCALAMSAVNNHTYSGGTEGLWGPLAATGAYGVTPTSPGVITTAASQPDWCTVTGIIVVNAAGTIIPQYNQGSGSNTSNAINLLANSYVMITKVG